MTKEEMKKLTNEELIMKILVEILSCVGSYFTPEIGIEQLEEEIKRRIEDGKNSRLQAFPLMR